MVSRYKTFYNKDLLFTIIARDNCVIDVNNYDKLTREIRLDFICKCGNHGNKSFRQIYEVNAFCKNCTEIEKIKKRREYYEKNVEKKIQRINKIKNTSLKLNTENPNRQSNIIKKQKETKLKRDIENPNRKIERIIKRKNTENILNLNNPNRKNDIIKKMKKTNLEKFGVEIPMHSKDVCERLKKTNLEKYGVINAFQSEEIKQKIKETNLKKYGFEYPNQNPDIFENVSKTSYKYKNYVFPNGITIKVQGYEPKALDELIHEGYNSSDIVTERSKVPTIWYNDERFKKHRYYVDIYIPKINKMIEVKSTWTYKKKKDNINLKANECIKHGYIYEIWIYDDKTKEIVKFI